MNRKEIEQKLANDKDLKDLILRRCFHYDDICRYYNIEYNQYHRHVISEILKDKHISLLYAANNSRLARLTTLYLEDMSHWWTNQDIVEEVQYSLRNKLILNYADKNKTIPRYVIAFKNHPRASKSNQVKAHIILWELENKQLFPNNYVLVPKDKCFTNLSIDNFILMSNEDYRSMVATGERNHFYVSGNKQGIAYKGGWKTISKNILKNNSCAICGASDKGSLDVHHIISYFLFDKPKDAHFEDNLICLCDRCHANLHSDKINLSGVISEKRCSKLLELLGQLKEKYKDTDLYSLVLFSIKSISSRVSKNEIQGSTTIPEGSTLQANGSGSEELLTDNAEDEEIV